jgi:hypothetical protein
MLRGTLSITATVASVCALAGCSSASAPEAASTTIQAATLSPQCSHGGAGPTTVTLIAFDAHTLELEAVNARGALVVGWLSPDTVEVAADLRAFPPDPIFPQCTDDASTYNESVGDGLSHTLIGDLGALASDGCNASVTLAADGTVTTFQPVP